MICACRITDRTLSFQFPYSDVALARPLPHVLQWPRYWKAYSSQNKVWRLLTFGDLVVQICRNVRGLYNISYEVSAR
jgi:hypothetical protein